jgi:hypothetical protein
MGHEMRTGLAMLRAMIGSALVLIGIVGLPFTIPDPGGIAIAVLLILSGVWCLRAARRAVDARTGDPGLLR